MQRIQAHYVMPDSTPVPSPPVCERIATNQIGDRQIISLNEPILDEPGSATWSGADSGNTGLHQRFVYEEVVFGASSIRDINFLAETAPAVPLLMVSVNAEPGDLFFAACYVRHATVANTQLYTFANNQLVLFNVTGNQVLQADGSVGHFITGYAIPTGETENGGRQVWVTFDAIPTYAVLMVVSVKDVLAVDIGVLAQSQASALPDLETLINTIGWNQNLCFFATHESGIGHTVASPWTERLQVTHSDLFFTLIERYVESPSSTFFPELAVDSWSAANTLMGGVAISGGGEGEATDQQYIVMSSIVGSDFADGEVLSAS